MTGVAEPITEKKHRAAGNGDGYNGFHHGVCRFFFPVQSVTEEIRANNSLEVL
jgi:hypothetical protein